MGLLEQILSSVGNSSAAPGQPGPQGQSSSPPQQGQSMLHSVMALINSPQIGGLHGLVQIMQSKGMGDIVSRWVGTGPNPPVSPAQLKDAIGNDHVQQFAQQTGMSHDQAASSLAQLLPHVVDQLTPTGTVPQHGLDMSSALEMLKSKFLH
jgi:uncharacterized protein YidB (DUF937 family)